MILSRYLTCLLLYALCSHMLTAQTQIKYHKTTGFDTNFPFDEPFQVKLDGFENDTPYTQYQMIFRKLDRKKDLGTYKSDTAFYKSLHSFTVNFAGNGIGIYPGFMGPNEYYVVDVVKPSRRLLSTVEKYNLVAKLREDETLTNAYMDLIGRMDISNFHPEMLQLPLAQRLAQENIFFVSATSSGQTLTDNALEQTIPQFIKHAYDFGTRIRQINKNLKRSNPQEQAFISTFETLAPQFPWVDNEGNLHPATETFNSRKFRSELQTLDKKSTTGIDKEIVEEINDIIPLRDTLMQAYEKLITLLSEQTEKEIYNNEWGSVLASSKVNEELVEGNTNRMNASISQTFGWGFSPTTSNGYLYVGYTLFFRPVNYSVPLRNIRGCWEKTKAMVGLNLGFTLSDIETNGYGEASGIVKFLGNKGLIVGLGIRPYHFIKVDLNGLLYNISDPNPLITHKKVAFAPMIGVSLNINLIKLFQGDPNSFTTLFKP